MELYQETNWIKVYIMKDIKGNLFENDSEIAKAFQKLFFALSRREVHEMTYASYAQEKLDVYISNKMQK